jgi:hypothetical protein
MLTDAQLFDLAKRMKFPLERVCFKTELSEEPLVYNKGYIINLDDEMDEDTGELNGGTHWVAFQINKYPNDTVQGIYMDPFGVGPPQDVTDFVGKIPYVEKDIQGLRDNFCGWVCCAFLHYINAAPNRTKDLYTDVETFMDFFLDQKKTNDLEGQNEWVLKQFFKREKPNF